MSGVTQQEEEKKPAGDQGGHINLKVKSQVFFLLFKFFYLAAIIYDANCFSFWSSD